MSCLELNPKMIWSEIILLGKALMPSEIELLWTERQITKGFQTSIPNLYKLNSMILMFATVQIPLLNYQSSKLFNWAPTEGFKSKGVSYWFIIPFGFNQTPLLYEPHTRTIKLQLPDPNNQHTYKLWKCFKKYNLLEDS